MNHLLSFALHHVVLLSFALHHVVLLFFVLLLLHSVSLLLLHFAFGFSLSLRSAFSLLLPSAAAAIGWFLPQRHVETVEQQLQQVHLEIDSNQERDRNIHQSQHQFIIDSLLYIWKYTLTADGNYSNH